jgi:hypothetical protein
LRCGTHPAGRARLSAFHHGSHLRELFHPKGSASGQASWDAVCTGVTRLRLSQSREAPPTPVIMPGDMMPKPPESSVQNHPRAPHPLHPSACLRKASLVSGISLRNLSGDECQATVTFKLTY